MSDISIGRLGGGFCVYWWTDGKRHRHQLEARTVAEARAEAVEVYRQKTYAARLRAPTVAEIWELYRKDLSEKPTAKTMGHTGKAVLPHFGEHRPEDITKAMCRAYFDARTAAGKAQGSIWTELGHLQSALNFAKATRMIPDHVRVWRPQKPETDKRILNPGEGRALIDGAVEPHIRLAIILLLGTGARIGAILDLTWDRVEFDRGVINFRLNDSVTRKGRAVVPMNATVKAALVAMHEAALSEYVIERAGRQVASIRKGFTAAVGRSGIGRVTIHECRHTAAVTMLAGGVPIEKVGQVLGHSNLATTYRIYGRYLPDHMRDAVNLLNFGEIRNA